MFEYKFKIFRGGQHQAELGDFIGNKNSNAKPLKKNGKLILNSKVKEETRNSQSHHEVEENKRRSHQVQEPLIQKTQSYQEDRRRRNEPKQTPQQLNHEQEDDDYEDTDKQFLETFNGEDNDQIDVAQLRRRRRRPQNTAPNPMPINSHHNNNQSVYDDYQISHRNQTNQRPIQGRHNTNMQRSKSINEYDDNNRDFNHNNNSNYSNRSFKSNRNDLNNNFNKKFHNPPQNEMTNNQRSNEIKQQHQQQQPQFESNNIIPKSKSDYSNLNQQYQKQMQPQPQPQQQPQQQQQQEIPKRYSSIRNQRPSVQGQTSSLITNPQLNPQLNPMPSQVQQTNLNQQSQTSFKMTFHNSNQSPRQQPQPLQQQQQQQQPLQQVQVQQNWQNNQARAITNITKSPNQFQLHSMPMNMQSPPGMSRIQQQQQQQSPNPLALNQQPFYFMPNDYAVAAAAQEYAVAMAAVAAMSNPMFLAQNPMVQNSGNNIQSVNNQIPHGALHIHGQHPLPQQQQHPPPPPRQSKAIQIVNPNNPRFATTQNNSNA